MMRIETTKNKLFALLVILLCSISINAQNFQLEGPDQLCAGECGDYTLLINGDPGGLGEYNWFDGTGNSLFSDISTQQFCFDFVGANIIFVEGIVDSFEFIASYSVLVGEGILPDIISTTASNCPDNNTPGSCEKVCAHSTSTYTIPFSGGLGVEWDVQGADSYGVNGDVVTVTWGNPGDGLITATSFSVISNPDTLQLYCGASPSYSPNILSGTAWVFSTGGTPPYSYQWSNGATTPTLNGLDFGDYCVTVVDGDGNTATCCAFVGEQNCTPTGTNPIFIATSTQPASSCDFCDGSIFSTATGGEAPYIYEWSNGLSGSDFQDACSGYYEVTITDGLGCYAIAGAYVSCPGGNSTTTCTSTTELCIDIIEDPEAVITSTPPIDAASGMIEICQGQTIFFGNESTNAESYEWSSGTGQMADTEEASFTYSDGGLYEVMLVAKNECFCSDTTVVLVNVAFSEGPQIDCVGTICENETVTYTANANGCSIYNWTISPNGTIEAGGSTANDFITINWGAGSEGIIELSVTNCNTVFCQSPTIEIVPIISDNAEIEGPEKVCRGDVAVYSITKWNGTSYNWTVSNFGTIKSGQNTNEIVVKWDVSFIPSAQQLVSVDYENCYLECSGSDQQTVDILPEFYVIGSIEACQNSMSTYQVKNSVTNAFTMASFELTAADGSVVWSSGGVTSNANVTWPSTIGTYTLTATAAVPSDYCFNETRLEIEVIEAPAAPTGVDGPLLVCPGEVFNYTVLTPNPNNAFQWEVNDGGNISMASGPSINVTWGNSPPYEVSVVEISTTGLACYSDPTSFSSSPIVDLDITGDPDVCVEETIIYSATFYEEVDYVWSISPVDAGTVVSGQNSEVVEILWHTDLVATLQVDMCGLSEQFPVNVYPLPEPMVNHPVGLCAGSVVTLNTTTPYLSYSWLDEDGNEVSTLATPDLPAGYYEVVVVDANACQGNGTFFIEEYPLPEIRISTPEATAFCTGDPTPTLYALNTNDGYTYQWLLDGLPIGGNTVSINAATFGNYNLQVTDLNGCVNTSNTIPVVDYCGPPPNGTCTGGTCTAPNPCDPGTVSFTIASTNQCPESQYTNTTIGLIPGTTSWNFGDYDSGPNNYSTDENPTHDFSVAGFFTVIMYVDNTTGTNCFYAAVDTVPIVANFDAVTACAGSPTDFIELTTFLPLPFAAVTGYEWNFGDPASGTNNASTDQNPTHTFATAGIYNVSLTSTNQDGCTSTRVKEVIVYESPAVSFPIPGFNCEGTPLEFNANVPANVVELLWNFGDPASAAANEATLENTFHAFDSPGNYTVTLTATNIYGCSASYNSIITIDPNPLNGIIDYSSPICEGVTMTLTAPAGGASWIWSSGEITESIQKSEAGIYGVTMTDAMGCIYIPGAATLDVIPAPDANILATEFNEFGQPIENFYFDYSTCEGEGVTLSVVGQGNYTYQWSVGSSSTQLIYDDTHLGYLTVGVHDFIVTVTDVSTGCTSEVGPYTVTINPLPTNVQITANPIPVCAPQMTTFSVLSPQVGYTYLWSNGAIGETMVTSIAGEYYVTAITPFGCSGESNTLEIFSAPDITLVPDGCHERCAPDEICLPNIPGVVSYQWFLDGNLIPAPEGTIANYVADSTGNYQVLLTDGNGCTALSDGLHLTILPIDTMMLMFDACVGEMIDYEGNQLLAGDVYDFTYSNQDGCDSTVIVTVTENPVYDMFIDLESCEGSTVLYQGASYAAGSQTVLPLMSIYGCDSTVTINVATIPVFSTALTMETCPNEMVDYNGITLAPGDSYEVTLSSSLGCDSTVNVTVNAYASFSFNASVSEPICFNTNNGYIKVEDISGSTGPYLFSTDGETFATSDSIPQLAGGEHTVYVQDNNGCVQSLQTSIGEIEPIEFFLDEVVLECSKDSVKISPILTSNYPEQVNWFWPDGENDDQFAAYDPGQFMLRLENQCEVKDQVVDVSLQLDGRNDIFYVPNVFSPNGDGANDFFTGMHPPEVNVIEWELSIFDRWGTTLYRSNDINKGWDGFFNRKKTNPGVYIWMYKATVETCHRQMEMMDTGDVTVLR
ncbi:MAG: gliding motility-associated-like protein [Nonlabens sp.]|jgi:gliding motility-associated-like protein